MDTPAARIRIQARTSSRGLEIGQQSIRLATTATRR